MFLLLKCLHRSSKLNKTASKTYHVSFLVIWISNQTQLCLFFSDAGCDKTTTVMLEGVGEIPNAVTQRQTSTNKKWAVLKSTKQTPTKRQNTHRRNTKVIKTVEFNQEQQQSRDGPAYDVTKDRGWQKVIREWHTRGWWGLSERDYTGELNQGKHEVEVKLRHTSEITGNKASK